MASEGEKSQDRVRELVTCPKCGHSTAAGTRYCDNCGASLTGATPAKAMEATSEKKGGFFSRLFGKKS